MAATSEVRTSSVGNSSGLLRRFGAGSATAGTGESRSSNADLRRWLGSSSVSKISNLLWRQHGNF
jgi:hypothetical protein